MIIPDLQFGFIVGPSHIHTRVVFQSSFLQGEFPPVSIQFDKRVCISSVLLDLRIKFTSKTLHNFTVVHSKWICQGSQREIKMDRKLKASEKYSSFFFPLHFYLFPSS